MQPDIRLLFTTRRLRITQPRLIVFATLKNAPGPVSIADIVKQCPSIDRVSVYRTIELFLRLHIVEIIAHGWKQRYELAAPFRAHHHHLLCTRCSVVVEINSDKIEDLIHLLASEHGFKAARHTFEIMGLCSTCQKTTHQAV